MFSDKTQQILKLFWLSTCLDEVVLMVLFFCFLEHRNNIEIEIIYYNLHVRQVLNKISIEEKIRIAIFYVNLYH